MSKEIGLEDIAGQIANAKTLGLTFTEHDFMALTKGVGTTQELTEEQLQAVAGGFILGRALSKDPPWARGGGEDNGSPGPAQRFGTRGGITRLVRSFLFSWGPRQIRPTLRPEGLRLAL